MSFLHRQALDHGRTLLQSGSADVARRSHPPASGPVALLSSFTRPETLVIPLWTGLNRIGHRPPLGDYLPLERGRWFESRQWLIVLHGDTVLVVDDRTTNQSCVLDPEVPRLEGVIDRRFERTDVAPRDLLDHPATTRLDWHGTESVLLREGSTLYSCYAGFAFGWIPDPRSASGAPTVPGDRGS